MLTEFGDGVFMVLRSAMRSRTRVRVRRSPHRGWAPASVIVLTAAPLVAVMVLSGGHGGGRYTARGPVQAKLAGCDSAPAGSSCSVWSGWLTTAPNVTQISASFLIPQNACANSPGGTTFWVGIDGPSPTDPSVGAIAQAGFQINCSGGVASFPIWFANAQGGETFVGPEPAGQNQGLTGETGIDTGDPVQPGDTVAVQIFSAGTTESAAENGDIIISGNYVMEISDTARSWSFSQNISDGPATSSYSAVAAESTAPDSFSGPLQVSEATVNGGPIGGASPQLNVQDSSAYGNGPASLVPSPLDSSGENFSFQWSDSGAQEAQAANPAPTG